jgi:methyltransferase (TIGR00027 family)
MAAVGAKPACDRRTIAADLTEPWQEALLAAGFDAARPACWLVEGLLFYLPSDEIVKILDGVAEFAAPGSRLGCDVINSALLTNPYTRPWVDMQAKAGAPWIGTLDDPAGFFAERGWDASLTQAGQPDANHGRWTLPVLPVNLPGAPHNWFLTASKR